MPDPRESQHCHFCRKRANHSILWNEGMAYVSVCMSHDGDARLRLREEGESIVDIVAIRPGPRSYREHLHPNLRMAHALEPAPEFAYCEDAIGTHFGRRVGMDRKLSALLGETPAAPPRVARSGRRAAPRGATIKTRSGKGIQGISGDPIKRRSGGDIRTRSTDPHRVISGKYIPDSLLQMLGTDWKTLKATRLHDNRLTLNIDGVRYSLYTRRG